MSVRRIVIGLAMMSMTSSACLSANAEPGNAGSSIQYLQASTALQDDDEQLKMAAIQGLMSTSSERALPILKKVLNGNHSDELKSRALFVVSQFDAADAQALILQMAQSPGPLQKDAIRNIGISGQATNLQALRSIYTNGDIDTKEHVLRAYLIADDKSSVFALANDAADDEEFENAVRTLGVMGATEELRKLSNRTVNSEALLQAYSISGDFQSLKKVAEGDSDVKHRRAAIRHIGIIGNAESKQMLVDFYRQNKEEPLRKAALQGLMISDHEEGLLELYRSSQDTSEKSQILKMLVNMDSELALEIIDSTLGGN